MTLRTDGLCLSNGQLFRLTYSNKKSLDECSSRLRSLGSNKFGQIGLIPAIRFVATATVSTAITAASIIASLRDVAVA